MRMENLKERLGRIPTSEKDASANVGTEYEEVRIELIREQLREVKLRNEALEEENRGDSQDRGQRKDFAERIYSFASIYMFFVFLILFLSGSEHSKFSLSDNVIITLLGTTTANVIGILVVVVTYLFSRKKK